MKESLIADDLFRRAFIVALLIGVLCRGLVLRVTDKQYPSRPQDYLEQIIISGLSASLGAIAFPALIDKEFSALTFFAVAIQQFQGLSQEERITIENIGLEDTRSKYLKEGIAIEIIPKNMKAYGVVSDLGQRQAVLHNLFIHFGINKDIDEKDLLATTKINLDKNTVVIPYLPLVKDIDELIKVVKSTPILEVSKGKQSAYSGEKL